MNGRGDSSEVWGCVLIGGQSRRMGTPKHLLVQEGRTWIERTVAVLEPLVGQVVLAGAGMLPASLFGMERVNDVPGLGGPLAGLLAVFRAHPGVSWLVAACDLPDLRAEALVWLLGCRAPGVRAILPDLAGDGRVEPLLAYYHQSCREPLEVLATQGLLRVSRLAAVPGVLTPQPPAVLQGSWRNVNTPEDLACSPGPGQGVGPEDGNGGGAVGRNLMQTMEG